MGSLLAKQTQRPGERFYQVLAGIVLAMGESADLSRQAGMALYGIEGFQPFLLRSLVKVTAGWFLAMAISPAQKLLRQGMGIRKAPIVQQEVTPPAPPAPDAVQEGQEDRVMGGFHPSSPQWAEVPG